MTGCGHLTIVRYCASCRLAKRREWQRNYQLGRRVDAKFLAAQVVARRERLDSQRRKVG